MQTAKTPGNPPAPKPPRANRIRSQLKSNLGFNVKYNKQGTNLQGNINIILRSGGRTYQIKSTSMSSLGLTTTATGGYGSFISKANIRDITDEANPISVAGNNSLTITFSDNGEPGTNDTIGIAVYNGSTLQFSSNWSGTTTTEKNLGGGNLAAR